MPVCVDNPLSLTLSEPAPAGSYSFIVGGNLPPQAPPNGAPAEFFSVIVRAEDDSVLEASYDLPPRTPLRELKARDARLGWSGTPRAEKPTRVKVSINFDEETVGVRALLITLPPGMRHDVQSPTNVKNHNKNFPVAPAADWIDSSQETYLRVIVNEDYGYLSPIPAGKYDFEFPILFPSSTASENVWYLSLCASLACSNITTQSAILIPMIFPMPGFREGQLEGDLRGGTGGGGGEGSSAVLGAVPSFFSSLGVLLLIHILIQKT